MNATQLDILRDELNSDPKGLGYSSHLPHNSGKVVELLNENKFTHATSRMITARAILAEISDGDVILDKLEQFGANNNKVKWAVIFLKQEAGIDVGHPATQMMLTQLGAANVITHTQAAALKDMANAPCSRAEQLGLGVINDSNITEALYNDDGSAR